jgi:hypothetical protein
MLPEKNILISNTDYLFEIIQRFILKERGKIFLVTAKALVICQFVRFLQGIHLERKLDGFYEIEGFLPSLNIFISNL